MENNYLDQCYRYRHIFGWFILLALFFSFLLISAGENNFVNPTSVSEEISIDNLDVSQSIYGTLDGFAHTFVFSVEDKKTISFNLDVKEVSQGPKPSIILVKKEKRGVSEVKRVKGSTVGWGETFDWLTVSSFVSSEVANTELGSGDYILEVSLPDNNGKYKLNLYGNNSGNSSLYMSMTDLWQINDFYGDGWWKLVFTPLYLTLIIFIVYTAYLLGFLGLIKLFWSNLRSAFNTKRL